MVIVNLKDIRNLNLPLNTNEKILKLENRNIQRSQARGILKKLEQKYGQKTQKLMTRFEDCYCIYANVVYAYIPDEVKSQWLTYYEIYVRSSSEYKMFIWLNKFFKF